MILTNLLHAMPERAFDARAMQGSPSIGEMFGHIHYVRLVFISEDVPEFVQTLPEREWFVERDPERMAQMLNHSAKAVSNAVKSRVESGQEMNLHYDQPILFLQHMIWHEGYHHGQIKLVLKLTDQSMSDEQAGPLTWGIWMRK
jgi:uncharacterized damage-inducible protein DinB